MEPDEEQGMCSDLMNDIISTSVGGAFGGAAAGLVLYGVQHIHQAVVDKRDSRRIYNWLSKQGWQKGDAYFRSTRTIASYTNLTEDRVRYLCSVHPKIYQSTGQKPDMWGHDEKQVRAFDNLPE